MSAWIAKILSAIFGNDIVQTIVKVALGSIAVDTIGLLFKGIKGLPGQAAIGNLDIGQEDFSKIIQSMVDNGDISSEAAISLSSVYGYLAQDSSAVKLVGVVAVLFNYFTMAGKAGSGKIQQTYNERNRPNVPDPVYVVESMRFQGELQSNAADVLRRNGWSDTDIAIVQGALRKPIDPGSVLQLLLNGSDALGDPVAKLMESGMSADDASLFIQSTPTVPAPSLLISLLMGTVVNEDVATQFELDSNIPQKLAEWLKVSGLGSEWAQLFWRAHYTIPPIEMAYGAYNRGLIDRTQLHLYYESVNLPPGLYSVLDELAATPVSMLQASEALQNGLISPSDFIDIAKQNGFSDSAAELLQRVSQSTLNANATSQTIQGIQYAISDGFVSDTQGQVMFESLGFTAAQAEMQVQLAHYNAQYQYVKSSLSAIETSFKTRKIDGNTANAQLVALGLLPSKIQAYLTLWGQQQTAILKPPTPTDIKAMMKQKLINESQAIQYLGENGYDATTAARLAALYLAENGG